MRLPLLALALATLLIQPPAPGEIRLIVKGDDMGAAHGINAGTIDAYTGGILQHDERDRAGTVVPRGRANCCARTLGSTLACTWQSPASGTT